MAWFSPRIPKRAKVRLARSSTSPTALDSLLPSGPFEAEVYVLREINAWEERRAVAKPTWNLYDGSSVSKRKRSKTEIQIKPKSHTGLLDVQSGGYLTANELAARVTMTAHEMEYFLAQIAQPSWRVETSTMRPRVGADDYILSGGLRGHMDARRMRRRRMSIAQSRM